MTDDDPVADLLLAWEDAQDRGDAVTPEHLCRDRPDLLAAVRERVRLLENAAWLRNPPSATESPRTLAGRYALEQLIGSGGYAQVWRAYDIRLHRHVAVKVPRPSRALTAEQVADVLTEARHVARLKHPGIVAVHDVVQEGTRYFIVADLIDGGTLADRLRRGPVPLAETAKMLAEVARVVAYAHGQGVVHRDLKPANVFLDRQGRPHVGDFGLARSAKDLLDGSDQRGTLAYSSPEQLDGGPLDGRSDIWSLGVILYEMVAGRPPFADDNPVRLRQAILSTQLPEAPGVPSAIMAVCHRCLATRPEDRFANGHDLAVAIEVYTAPQRSRRWLLPLTLAATVGVGLTISLIRTSEPGRTQESDPPAVAAKTGVVIPPKIEPAAKPTNPTAVLDWVRSIGGKVVESPASTSERRLVETIELDGLPLSDLDLTRLGQLPHVKHLKVRWCGASDSWLVSLEEVGGLEVLNLSGTRCTDAGVATLGRLKRLMHLNLQDTRITDSGLGGLSSMPVTELSLEGTAITDAGMLVLAKSATIYKLDISRTSVGPAGLRRLQKLKSLRSLHANGISVSPAHADAIIGMQSLQHLTIRGVDETSLEAIRKARPDIVIKTQ